MNDTTLLVIFQTFGRRADPVGMVCRLTGGGAFTTNDGGVYRFPSY